MPRSAPLFTAILATLIAGTSTAQTQDTTVTYTYDQLGNVKTRTRPLGHLSSYQYDMLSRLTQDDVTATGGTLTTKLAYDAQGQLTKVTDPRALVTTYTKDGLGNTNALSSPDTAGSSYGVDAAGEITLMTDARGKITALQYDALGRVTLAQYQSGVPTQFEYDGGPGGPSSETGNLTRMTDESGSTTYTHDLRGRILTKIQRATAGGSAVDLQLRYAYGSSGSEAGKLKSLTYPSGARVNYQYDNAGRVSSLTLNPSDGAGGTSSMTETPLISNITWTPSCAVSSWTWGSGALPTYTRGYDLDGRLVSYSVDPSGMTRTLTWNAANLITAYTHTGGSNPGQYDQSFAYDLADRMTSFTQAGATTTYQYDADGNRTQQTGPAGNYIFSTSSNRLMSASLPQPRSYSYDAVGNPTGDGHLTFTYSDRGRLAYVGGTTSLAMLYNGLGQRVVKVSGSTPTYYVYDESGHTVGQYGPVQTDETVYLGELPVVVITPSARHYILADHLNTPLVLLKDDGTVSWDWRIRDPFGNNAPVSGVGFIGYDHRFPGQIVDSETGLFYNYFRDYDPQTGRYIESDPIGLKGGINTYGYVGGNPVTQSDPQGLNCVASGGTVTCNVPGGPGITFPRPAGWPAHIRPGDTNYHAYNEWVKTAGVNKKCLDDYVRNHPTPGSPSAATPGGTANNASPSWVPSFSPSPVTSYSMNSNGSQVVVNVTMPGHPLFPGYVARVNNADGTINNFGEGTGALQGPYSPLARPINNVWQGLTDEAINACRCK